MALQLIMTTVDAHAVTNGRLVATTASLLALAGAVAGGWALARPIKRRRGALAAVTAGPAARAVGVWVLVTADGGPGTGNGVVGGYAAVVFGLVALVLGGLGLARGPQRLERTA
jgi:hypothetical protein